jgi:hypothetical protein
MQPQNRLNQQSGAYDPFQAADIEDDTSYHGGSSERVGRLPSMRSPAGQKVFPAVAGSPAPHPTLVIEADERGRSTSRKRKEAAT